MGQPISDIGQLLRTLRPLLNDGCFAFVSVPDARALAGLSALAGFREREGVSAIVREADAIQAGLAIGFRAAWISLGVASDLQAVGLTAAVASVLADAGIACNVVAALHHDHLFVPYARAQEALDLLRSLQEQTAPT